MPKPDVFGHLPKQREIEMIHSLEDIYDWLGTYRERLRLARPTDRSEVGIVISQLEARLQVRRAELA